MNTNSNSKVIRWSATIRTQFVYGFGLTRANKLCRNGSIPAYYFTRTLTINIVIIYLPHRGLWDVLYETGGSEEAARLLSATRVGVCIIPY